MKSFRSKIHSVALLAVTVSVFSLAGCDMYSPTAADPKASTAPSAEPAPSRAKITASPNPIAEGPDPGKTTISWDTGDGTPGQLYFKVNNMEEKRWISGRAKGSQEVNWIKKGARYEFKLYAGTNREKLLASVTVTKKAN